MELIIILLLIILNGLFAMAEIAIVSSRKSRLKQLASEGDKNAQAALDLAQSPSRFMSTVQIGLTFVGVFTGAFGGETLAKQLSPQLANMPIIGPYHDFLAILLVVAGITYLSLMIGELVPKRLALSAPERIASLIAPSMKVLSSVASPVVTMLTFSSDLLLRGLNIKSTNESSVSEEEVRMLINEGAKIGIFNIAEQDIVERTFKLSDKKVNQLMTPRKEIVWLDIDSPFKTLRSKLAKYPHTHFPVCRDSLDKVLGIVRTGDLLTHFLLEEKIELQKYLHKALFVPESMDVFKVLEMFKKSGIHAALVIDEYGNIQGMISLTDVFEAIVGDVPSFDELKSQEIVLRDDGSFLVDGLVPIDEFKDRFNIKKLPDEKSGVYHTIGGFVMHKIGKIPVVGDKFVWGNHRFEVVDMDGNRIDKVLVSKLKKNEIL